MNDNKPEFQKIRDLKSRNNYTKWRSMRSEFPEPTAANPDVLSDGKGYAAQMKRGPREMKAFNILDRAVRSLSKKQRDAYKAVYKDGFTLAAAGLFLGGVSPQAIKKNVDAAVRNISAYCKLHEGELENAE